MSTQEQRIENNGKIEYIINKACGNNEDAKKYLFGIAKAARTADDLYDQDIFIDHSDCFNVIQFFWLELPHNSFYLEHREKLEAMQTVIWNAWLDSNVLEKGDSTDQIYYHVLRDLICELLPYVAFVLQGYNKMREVSIETRILFKKQQGE